MSWPAVLGEWFSCICKFSWCLEVLQSGPSPAGYGPLCLLQGLEHLTHFDGNLCSPKQALDQLDAMLAQQSTDAAGDAQTDAAFASAALLRRLSDDDVGVLRTALASKALPSLPPDDLVRGLGLLLRRARESAGRKGLPSTDRSGMKAIAKQVCALYSEAPQRPLCLKSS